MLKTFAISMIGIMLLAMPAHAEFRNFDDVQGDLAERKERDQKQMEDTAKTREAAQENTALLKGILLELRKHSEMLEAIQVEQKNQTLELSRQTELLKSSPSTRKTN